MFSRVRSVVNSYVLADMDDAEVEVTFTEAVNDSLRELDAAGAKVTSITYSTQLNDEILVKSADIQYSSDEELDVDVEEDDEDEVPELGVGLKKVTREVFNWIKERFAEDWSPKEISEAFEGSLSVWTVNKVLKTRKFSQYYGS